MHKLNNIQMLRALAAFLVVVYHSGSIFGYHNDFLSYGNLGVDMFFVISGFIITKTVHNPNFKFNLFFLKRIIRIYPLYWVYLIAFILLDKQIFGNTPSVDSLFSSFLLLPIDNFTPLLSQGWTLQFELYFYLVIVVFFYTFRLNYVAPVIIYIILSPILFENFEILSGILSSTIIYEFLYGVLLYKLISSKWILSNLVLIFILSMTSILFVSYNYYGFINDGYRFLYSGLFSLSIVLASFYFKNINKIFILLGNVSYTTYLSHGFVIYTLKYVASYFGFESSIALVIVSIVVVHLSSVSLFYMLEKPLINNLNKLLFR